MLLLKEYKVIILIIIVIKIANLFFHDLIKRKFNIIKSIIIINQAILVALKIKVSNDIIKAENKINVLTNSSYRVIIAVPVWYELFVLV